MQLRVPVLPPARAPGRCRARHAAAGITKHGAGAKWDIEFEGYSMTMGVSNCAVTVLSSADYVQF
jgi:hypothetical protein